MQLIISEIGKSSPSDKTRNKMVMFCCQDQKYGSHVYLFCPGIEKSRRIDKAKIESQVVALKTVWLTRQGYLSQVTVGKD